MIIGAVLSGGVLVLTFWPAVKDDTKRVAIIAIGLIFLCHLLLASGFVVSIRIVKEEYLMIILGYFHRSK